MLGNGSTNEIQTRNMQEKKYYSQFGGTKYRG